jgi:uncharacterized repeat protein (TIGR01451 family)
MVPFSKIMWGRVLARLLALMLVLLPSTATPLTPAGTVINHHFTARFSNAFPQSASSNDVEITIRDTTDPAIAPPQSAVTLAGQPFDFVHTITNRGNSQDSFRLKASLVQGPLPDNGAQPKIEFYAADGKTLLPTDSSGLPVIGPLAPGASMDVVLRVTPPAGSAGLVEIINVTATSIQFPARNSSLKNQLVVPAPGGLLPPVKEVSPAGSVQPGSVLTYTISVSNPGVVPLAGVKVTDALHPQLDYQEGSAVFPAGLTGTASYDPSSRTVAFDIPSLPGSFTGVLNFQGRVKDDAPGGTSILNTALITSASSASPLASNTTLSLVVSGALQVVKQVGSAVAEVGDLVPYSIQVRNLSAGPLTHVVVSDKMPKGFRYLKGSTVLDGGSIGEPSGAGEEVGWDIGTVEAGATRTLSYRCAVSGDAPHGINVNWAAASGVTSTGRTVISPPASAALRVRPSILGDKAIILGRVFEDANGNGVPDPGDVGVAGVRIYLEDGSYVFTDKDGQYSFTGVAPGVHVAKVDKTTVPRRYQAIPYNTAFAGVGWSQFITVPFGGPVRGDFALAINDTPAAAFPHGPPAPPPGSTGSSGSSGSSGSTSSTRSTESTPSVVSSPPVPVPVPAPLAPADAVPAVLRITPERLDMPADGKTVVPFTVELLTSDGKRIPGSRLVTVSVSKGVVLDPDQDPSLPGHQLRVQDGICVLRIRSTGKDGKDEIVVKADNGTRGRGDLFFSPELRDWIVVGLGSLTVGSRGVSGHIEKIDKEDRFDEGFFHDERLAFFTRGKILGKYLLTAAYDSQKERRDAVFQMIDPEKYYPVYGDASDIGYEAQSRGKIYLKLEAGRSYLLAGDYRTDLSENEFSRYDRALYGVKGELNTEHLDVKGFESRTEDTLTKDEIPGNGTSGHYFLSRRPVLENSERVRIEVRDRYHTERLIQVTEKIRYADYTIDYNAGTILFKEPVPSLDQYLNPVTIVVNYQSQQGGIERYVYGGRALLKSQSGSYLGGTAVVEEGAGKDTKLFGVDGGLKFRDRLSIKGEAAFSDTPEKGRGKAWKTEVTASLLDGLTFGGYYRKVDADFLNRSMTGLATETGTEKYSGRLDYRGLSDTLIFAESFVQKDQVNGIKQYGNQAGFLRRFSLFEGEGGFKSIEQEQNGVEGRSNILYAGIKGTLTPRLAATLRRDQLLGSSSVAEYQSRTFLKIDYRLSEFTKAFLTEEYQEGSPLIRQATRFGVESRLSERMRLTTGYQFSNGISGSSEQSSVDLNTKLVDRDGFSLDSRSGYQVENSLSQERGQAILGLNSRFRAAEGLYLNSSLERVQTVQGRTGTRTAFALAGEYLRQKDLKVTGRYEFRTGPDEDASLYGAGLAYKATPSLTLLGKANFWDRETDFLGHERILDSYLGTAFRPLAGNPWQLLTLLRYKIEDHPGQGRNRSFIISGEPTYRIVKDWSAQGKYAGKIAWAQAGGRSFQSYTDLILAGISYDLAEKWDLSLYLKLMNQYDTGQHSFGSVASVGYRVYRNVIISAGYNYARLDDRDLTGESYQGQGPFVGVKVKFDEDMFESERAVVAAPLPAAPVVAEMPPVVPPPPLKAPERPALLLAASKMAVPLRISGSAEALSLLINGERVKLPSTAVTVGRERLEGSVDLKKGRPVAPIVFLASVEHPELVNSWTISIMNAGGRIVRRIEGSGAPSRRISWAADDVKLEERGIYQYQLQVNYRDGSHFSTARELFGVNRNDALLLSVAGGAFVFDSSALTPEGKRLLKGAARVLRAHPQERAIVEGHTDWIGSEGYNMTLSRRRCDAAADYLVQVEKISPSRLLRRWYGKSRPLADNSSDEGRQLNRRVELKAEFQERMSVSPTERYRTAPFVVINGTGIPVDSHGRFETALPPDTDLLTVEIGDSLGRSLATALPVPALRLVEPAAETVVHYGSTSGGITVDGQGRGTCAIAGGVEKGSYLEVDGKKVPLDEKGNFRVEVPLPAGEGVLGVVLRNDAGCSRLINLRLVARPQKTAPGGMQP